MFVFICVMCKILLRVLIGFLMMILFLWCLIVKCDVFWFMLKIYVVKILIYGCIVVMVVEEVGLIWEIVFMEVVLCDN